MGIDKFYPFLEDEGITGEEVDVASLDEIIQVDMLAIMRAYMSVTGKSIWISENLKDARRRNQQPPEALQRSCMESLARCVISKLGESGFRPSHCVLHFDGAATSQKQRARQERVSEAEDSVRLTKKAIQRTMATIQIHPPALPPSLLYPEPSTQRINRARKGRAMSRTQESLQAFKRSNVLSRDLVHELARTIEEKGWTVHICPGEADVCMSRQGSAIATSDSDLFFHGARAILRQDPRAKSKFTLYTVDEILHKLRLTSDAWALLAVVTRNDYCDCVRGPGIKTNLDITKSIRRFQSLTKEELLERYCVKVATTRNIELAPASYQQATDIFFRHHEDLVPYPAIGSGLEQEIATVIHEVERFRHAYRLQRQRPSVPAQARVTAPVLTASVEQMAFLGPAPFAAPLSAPIYAALPLPAPSFGTFALPILTPVPFAGSAVGPPGPVDADTSVLTGPAAPQVPAFLPGPVNADAPVLAGHAMLDIPVPTSAQSGDAQRPHQKIMSGNSFKITTYIQPANRALPLPATTSSSTSRKRKKKQTRKRKAVFNPSSRQARQVETEHDPQRIRMLRPATVMDQVLSNKFATVTLTCGTLQKQVKSALATNNVGDEEIRDQMANDITKLIRRW